MNETERLTSYLDGELATGELRALEAELAGDRALRERLQALRTADEALGMLPATELPEGARERLDTRLSNVLDEVLGGSADQDVTTLATAEDPLDHAPTTSEATGLPPDELAGRRRRRALPALTGVAAGLVLLAGGLLGLGQLELLTGQDESAADGGDVMTASDAARDMAPEIASEADGEGMGPVIIDQGRSISADDLDVLLATAELEELAATGLSAGDGATLAARFQSLLLGSAPGTATGPTADVAEEADEAEGAAEDGQAPARSTPFALDSAIVTRDGRPLDEDTATDLRRCLASLLEGGDQAIPQTVEVLEVDGVRAISFGLVTLAPDTDAFTRIEVWTLEQATCQVLRFDQS